MDAQPALSATDIAVRFGGAMALNGVTVAAWPGRVTGLTGNNGAGKTTLLHAVMGLVAPRQGRVCLAGRDVTGLAPRKLAALGVALVPEGRHLFTDQSVRENLQLGFVPRAGASFSEALDRAVVMFPEMAEHLDRTAGALSGGQQQMVAVARALVSSPDVLLLDEPFLGLAPVVVQRLRDSIRRLAAQGLAVIVADAAASRLMGFCDYTYILHVGEVAAEGDSEALNRMPVARQVLMGGV